MQNLDMHRDRTLVLNGQRFHYTEWGAATAPPLLMLHGVTGHARTWDEEAAALAARYRVLALDQRGHGDSDPSPNADYTVATMSADVVAFVDALGLSPGLDRRALDGRAGRDRLRRAGTGARRSAGDRGHRPGYLGGRTAPRRHAHGSLARAVSEPRARAGLPSPDQPALHRGDAPPSGPARHAARRGRSHLEIRSRASRRRARRERGAIRSTSGRSGAASPVRSCSCAAPTPTSCPPKIAKRMLDENPNTRFAEVPGAGHTVPGDQPVAFQAPARAISSRPDARARRRAA